MRYFRFILGLAAAVILAAAFPASSAALGAAAKNMPGMDFAYETAGGDRLELKAYLNNPQDPINSGMFVLKYDKELLSVKAEDIEAASGIVIPDSLKYIEEEKGYVGVDWYPTSTIEPSKNSSTEIVSIVFDVKGDIKDKTLFTVCDDAEYLDGLGGYGRYGGLILCTDSTNYFDEKDESVQSYIGYGLPKRNSGTLSVVLIIGGCVLAAAAAWYIANKNAHKGTAG